ncbi:MAG: tRNA lysidine(34) synthetase TilS [bacterium]|nr:tRNA lysidine(34) synthetase TilS [bacterium]
MGPFEQGIHVGVALSGGSDSLALTYLAQQWLERREGRLTAFIVDHGLRPESAQEAEKVAAWVGAWGVHPEILQLSCEHSLRPHRLQEDARKHRYDVLIQACKKHKIQHLLLGHHLEDQAETQVMRFLKGSGVSGLKGMQPVVERSGIRLLRPLLPFSKKKILSILPENQPWIEDPSNQSDQHLRNRLRCFLRGEPFVDLGQIARSAAKFERIEVFLDRCVGGFLKNSVLFSPYGYALLVHPLSKDLDLVVLERALSQLIQTYSGSLYPPRSQSILKLIDFLRDPNFSGVTCGGCLFKPYQEKILITREWDLSEKVLLGKEQENLVWDGRFSIENLSFFPKGTTLEALGEKGIQELRRKEIEINSLKCPSYVKRSLPCARFENNLMSVPHLKIAFQGKIDFQPRVLAIGESILKDKGLFKS